MGQKFYSLDIFVGFQSRKLGECFVAYSADVSPKFDVLEGKKIVENANIITNFIPA